MYYINKNVKDLYRVKFHDKRGEVLRLDMNENPVGLPADFVEEVKKKITPSFLSTYPEKDELIQLIAEHNGVAAENISLTCGSDEAMRLIFQCFGEEGKDLVTVTPTFEMYDVYSKMFGMNHVTIEYSTDFTVKVSDILESITSQTGIVILLNPNSPVGTAYTKEEFQAIVKKAAECNAIVVVDEAYHYFYAPTFIQDAVKEEHVIVLRTFSKLCSIAGLRVGYATANPQLIDYIEKAESTFNVNNVGILFATEVLKRPDLMEQMIQEEKEGHDWLAGEIKKAGYQVFSENGNYLLFYPHRDSKTIVNELKEQGIWIRDYGRGILKGWLRVSTGNLASMSKFWEAFLKVDENGD